MKAETHRFSNLRRAKNVTIVIKVTAFAKIFSVFGEPFN